MRRVQVLSALALLFLCAAPEARAVAPGDAPAVQAEQHPFAAWKKKKKSAPSKGGSQPQQASSPRPAPEPAQTPAPQRPAGDNPQPQRPADDGPQRPDGPAPEARPEARPSGPIANPDRPAGARPPGDLHDRPASVARPGAPAGTAHPAAPGAHLSAPGARSGPEAAAPHKAVTRPIPGNMAGASRRAVQGHAQAERAARDAQADRAQHAHDVRVSHAQAAARRDHAARHHRAAHAARAHRAWAHRHAAWAHRHHHPWWHPYPWYYGPWWRPAWSYGVFVYGPRPVYTTEVVYVDGAPPEPEREAPRRQVDRAHTFALGLRGGSYISAYEGGPGFNDFGLGLAGRYRATEALGFEIAWEHHDQTWTTDTARRSAPLAASVQLFAFPWTRFNPYIGTGVTWTERHYKETWSDLRRDHHVSEDGWLFGPHLGLGLEFGIGKSAAIDLEARFMGYVNRAPEDEVVPRAMQANVGLNFYF